MLSPNPSCALSGSSCCFAFYFLQPHYDRTGSHWIYHLLCWKAERVGGVTHEANAAHWFPTRTDGNMSTLLYQARTQMPTYNTIPGEVRHILQPFSPSTNKETLQRTQALQQGFLFVPQRRPISILPSPLPCSCSCTICKVFFCAENCLWKLCNSNRCSLDDITQQFSIAQGWS